MIEQILKKLNGTVHTIAVAAAEDDAVLHSVCEAWHRGVAVPILCGNPEKIQAIAKQEALDISSFEIVSAANPKEAAKAAVALVKEGRAEMLMKGLVQTADLLRAVLDKQCGLRGNGVLSHVSILRSPILERTLLLSDAAMVPYPDLKTKVAILNNTTAAARGMGIQTPKVAVLAAVEVVNTDMPATMDAALLTMMNRRGQIKDCIVDGPLAMDLALSPEAVKHKGVVSEVAGQADILLMPNIEAANSTLKTFTVAGDCLFGGVLMGAAAPIVLTSRSDSSESKLFSIACAALICNQNG